jgi:chorismate synthase
MWHTLKVCHIWASGRHDPYVVPRVVAIVEAIAALVLAHMWLRAQGQRVLLQEL